MPDGRDGTQKVIIILSDGAANKGPGYLPPTSPYRTNPCQTAVDVAGGCQVQRRADVLDRLRHRRAPAPRPAIADKGSIVNGSDRRAATRPKAPRSRRTTRSRRSRQPGNYYAQPEPVALTNIFLAISADIAKGTSRING